MQKPPDKKTKCYGPTDPSTVVAGFKVACTRQKQNKTKTKTKQKPKTNNQTFPSDRDVRMSTTRCKIT